MAADDACACGAARAGEARAACAVGAARAAATSTPAPPPPLRLLFLLPGSRGDVEPPLAVAEALMRAGHSVTIACHAAFEADVASLRGGGGGGRARFAPVAGAPTAGLGAAAAPRGADADALWAAQLADYQAAAAAAKPHAVLFNWFGVAGLHLAEALGVPCVALWPGAPLTRTRAFACPLLPPSAAPPAGDGALRSYALWEALLWRAAAAPLNAWRQRQLALPPLPPLPPAGHYALLAQRKVPVLYGFSPLVLPPPADWPARVMPCGAWARAPPAEWAHAPPRLRAFLDRPGGPPVLYCGFGSAALADGAAVAAACVAGGAAAGCRVLLAGGLGGGLPRVAGAACDEDDAEGATVDPATASVFWLREAPHAWLLPRCAAALHHAGAGTCAAALRAGVPQLLCPLQYDQPFWARRMRALGVAPEPLSITASNSGASASPFTADAVAAAVRRARSDAMRARALAMADALAGEADGAEVAALFVQQFVPAAAAAARAQAEAEAEAARSAAAGHAASCAQQKGGGGGGAQGALSPRRAVAAGH